MEEGTLNSQAWRIPPLEVVKTRNESSHLKNKVYQSENSHSAIKVVKNSKKSSKNNGFYFITSLWWSGLSFQRSQKQNEMYTQVKSAFEKLLENKHTHATNVFTCEQCSVNNYYTCWV